MAGTKALFASIGAGAALVAAAALSLLAVSAVFAFGGWADAATQSAERSPLVFAGSTLPAGGSVPAATAPIVARAPERRQQRRRDARPDTAASRIQASERSTLSVPARDASAPALRSPAQRPVVTAPAVTAPAAAPVRTTGDRVRNLGGSLGATVQSTGTALADATQPLAPPVSASVQQAMNLVAEAVQRTAGAVGSSVDTLLAPK